MRLASQEESSVLVSLKELQGITRDKIAAAKAEAARRAEEAAQAIRDAAKARAETEEARLRAIADAEAKAAREEEAARRRAREAVELQAMRARVDEEMRAAARRMMEDVIAEAANVKPRKSSWLVSAMGVLAMCGVGLGIFAVRSNEASDLAAARASATRIEAALVDQQTATLRAEVTRQTFDMIEGQVKLVSRAADEAAKLAPVPGAPIVRRPVTPPSRPVIETHKKPIDFTGLCKNGVAICHPIG
jgi:hypothetical protein